jgi:hypothetical protein
MKLLSTLVAFVAFVTLSACSHTTYPSGKVPPGQAKKMTGSKSAKPYAPGQQKKKH